MKKSEGYLSLLIILFLFAFCEGSWKNNNNSNNQPTGVNYEEVIFEGSLYSNMGKCLDNLGIIYGNQVGLVFCNGSKHQYWKILANGQIAQNELCLSYRGGNLIMSNCTNTEQTQIWTLYIQNSSQIMFINNGYSEQTEAEQCLTQGDQLGLSLCDQFSQRQLFSFTTPPSAPPPNPSAQNYEGPIYSLNSDYCFDTFFDMLCFRECNGDQKQRWKFVPSAVNKKSYMIQHENSSLCLSSQSEWLQLWQCVDGFMYHMWRLEQINNKQFKFITYESQLVGTPTCITQEGDFVQVSDCNKAQRNQIFSLTIPPPLPPSLPPSFTPLKFKGSIQSRSLQCLDNLFKMHGYQILGFTTCDYSNLNQQWQYLQNGLIKQVSSGLCSTCKSPEAIFEDYQSNLMLTQCNETHLTQLWMSLKFQDDYYSYANQGGCVAQKQAMCIHQDGEYAITGECNVSDASQLLTFLSPQSPAPSPHNNPSTISRGAIIAIVFAVAFTLIFLPFLVVFISKVVSRQWTHNKRGQSQQNKVDQSGSNLIEMLDLEEGLKDSIFYKSPDWWSEMQIPEGVQNIPITDLRGIQRLGDGGFAVELKQLIQTCWKARDERPSADEIESKLQTIIESESILAK